MPAIYENYTVLQNATQDYFAMGHDMTPMNHNFNMSPYSSNSPESRVSNMTSPISASSSPLHGENYITLNNAVLLGEPHITIVTQPVEKFRFRYKSEMMGTHGSLLGVNSPCDRRKHAPTAKLHNFPENAIIRCTLVTSEEEQRIPHAHRLVRREGSVDKDDPHDIEVSPENDFTASFHGMGIIHTAKKNIREELLRKMRSEALEKLRQKNVNACLSVRDEAQIKADVELYQKCMNLNSVTLCFQAYALNKDNVMIPITPPVYSNPINNLKSALTGELKICRIDKYTSSCEGGEEVFILVEKVGKKNIKVKLFELNEDNNEVWVDYGRFSELDVHHQYAIVFRTPPYKDLNITSPKEVYIQLERPSDSDCSEPVRFTYKPSDKIMGRKRARMSYSGSAELSHIISSYNNIAMDENESREISKELSKMLSDGCSSTEFKDFWARLDIDKYAELFDNSEEGKLTCDGPSSRKQHQDDTMFAKKTVLEAIKVIQSHPTNMKEQLQILLKDRTTYGDSPLHSALRYNQWNIAKYILMLMGTEPEYRALVNAQNSSGKTPLHYAVLQNQSEIVKALLVLGGDPNACDDYGFSPLHIAVRLPEAGACVDILLSEKVTNIEAHNDAGWTALQLAVEAGSCHAVHSLVKAGVDVNNTDMSYGRTALHIAVEGGHKDIVEFLLTRTNIDVNKRNFSGNTALHSAVVNSGTRAKELCQLLMQHGADPYIQNHNRESSFMDKRRVHPNTIKVEINSEEETGEESSGQTSFDLASNKPEILQLLTGEASNAQEDNDEMDTIITKQEIIEDDSEDSWLNLEEQTRLAEILDRTQGWKALAECLNVKFLINTLEQSSMSPTILLLNYVDVQGDTNLRKLQNLLMRIGETEAADHIAELISLRE